MVDKITLCFEDKMDVTDTKVQGFIRKPHVLAKFNNLFSGEGRSSLFVHYGLNYFHSECEQVGESSSVSSSSFRGSKKEIGPEFFVSFGDSVKMEAKCCYFIRTEDFVDTSVANDTALLYGEISDTPLKTIEAILSFAYRPMFSCSKEWGKANDEQKDDFKAELDRFTHTIVSALETMSGGLELRHPNSEEINNCDAKNLQSFTPSILESRDTICHLEEILEEWCNQIESYLATQTPESNGMDEETSFQCFLDDGPKGELDYWRTRMQRLTSIIEQLKRRDCKNVISLLSTFTKRKGDQSKEKSTYLLRRWKQIDIGITEAANEAKDNVKYLCTLQRFTDPLYSGTAQSIIDSLPALLNSIKMIHTIARYYNTTERMTKLFMKITEQMINNCKRNVTDGQDTDTLWHKKPSNLLNQLKLCLKLNEAYQGQYQVTKRKLQQMPTGKQFDFIEIQIFGKFDLFCRRVMKLIDLFTTVDQFTSLSENQLEGMEYLTDQFNTIKTEFKSRNHDLLDYQNNKFDRDFVEFNVRVSDLEGTLQEFVNNSFENMSSISHSLNLLHKFQRILQRETLKSDLDSKLNIIFLNYGLELEQVQQLYEKEKHDPPISRNLPPVAGNITWSRHLLKRIEEPIKKFETNQSLLAGRDAKRIIKMYNKVARTLVAFEFLWYKAWVQSIDQAKTGLQATLIIRHPDDGKLYVNFDHEILQLIREAKCLDRISVEIPESAKIAVFQEEKFKLYYTELHWTLTEYERIVTEVIPVTASILRPHFNDLEYKLRPGMITLTWTSMNIDAYIAHVFSGLK